MTQEPEGVSPAVCWAVVRGMEKSREGTGVLDGQQQGGNNCPQGDAHLVSLFWLGWSLCQRLTGMQQRKLWTSLLGAQSFTGWAVTSSVPPTTLCSRWAG